MAAVTVPAEAGPVATPVRPARGRLRRAWAVPAILAGWLALWFPLRGRDVLALPVPRFTPLHRRINGWRDDLDAVRYHNAFFTDVIAPLRDALDRLASLLQHLLSTPTATRPVPLIGWLGVLALAGFVAYAAGNARVAVLALAGFASFSLLGLWRESMDTLALTVEAVLICVLFGIPAGVLVGLVPALRRLVTPVLDFMQTMPTFVYLAPLTLFFSIGPAAGVLATVIYAAPPVIRITAFGITEVPRSTLEAGRSLGATGWQLLRGVQFPLARRLVLVGVNQTTMSALSMVTIAALINTPGLGAVTFTALRHGDVGEAFRGGLAIVVLAIVLDRVTTAAGDRAGQRHPDAPRRRARRLTLLAGGLLTLVAVYLAYTFTWAAFPPLGEDEGVVGARLVTGANTVDAYLRGHFAPVTNGIKDGFTAGLFNPFENLLTQAPWYLTVAAALALAWALGGARVVPVVGACLGLIIGTGLWSDAMATLAAVLVATAATVLVGVAAGVWLGRSTLADRVVRPVLDAAQVMPPFVYLVPALGLFQPSRFTAMFAAVVFAAPVVVKLVAEAVRGVPGSAVEAAVAAGSNRWQVIGKVQLPLGRRGIALAVNQGLIYVLSMVVVGGLVGGGALGYLVVAGFAQTSYFGKGLAAGAAIVLLGVALDRITQAAARRADPRGGHPAP
jgi:glycine betaine/proline transport system permease protein